jgi:hypothetical protein
MDSVCSTHGRDGKGVQNLSLHMKSPKGRHHLGALSMCGRHGNEHSDAIKAGKFLR